MLDRLSQLGDVLAKGGDVMPPLAVCAVLLFFGLGYRWVLLQGARSGARRLLEEARSGALVEATNVVSQAPIDGWRLLQARPARFRHRLDELFFAQRVELGRFSGLVQSIVGVAPLLGLLGTVTGMIETFESLGDSTFTSAAGGGVAGGIAEALYSTELGLVVAVPGLILGGLLDRRQSELELELQKLEDLLVQEARA